jgi:hypothetical protein
MVSSLAFLVIRTPGMSTKSSEVWKNRPMTTLKTTTELLVVTGPKLLRLLLLLPVLLLPVLLLLRLLRLLRLLPLDSRVCGAKQDSLTKRQMEYAYGNIT